MAHDVFISYSHKDKAIADAICSNLETAGMRCWIAPRDIAPGMDWPTAISAAITLSRVMVLVFSADSNRSKQVGNEISLAFDNNLIIIPFKIDAIAPEPGKQYYLARTHWLDAMNPPTQEQINTLVGYVRSFLSEQGTTGTVQPAPEVKPPPPQTVKVEPTSLQKRAKGKSIWIWSFLVVMAIIAGSIYALRSLVQSPIPTSTSGPTFTTTSTLPPTSISMPTSTPRPTSTQTPPPAWVAEFAQPILDAIASRAPSFQDDFGPESAGWQALSCGQRINYLDGELVLTDCKVTRQYIDYADFVVEFDAHFLPDTNKNTRSNWSVYFRQEYRFSVYFDGSVTLGLRPGDENFDFPYAANPGLETNHLLLIAKGLKLAFYMNNKPLYYYEKSSIIRQGTMDLIVDDGSGARDLAHPAIVAFDNFKIWNIYDLP
jgi:hypothetical protein